MKTTLITLACILVAPLAFGQASADDKTSRPTTYVQTDPYKAGTINSFEAGRSITISSTLATHPVRFVLAKDVVFQKQGGEAISPDSFTPGTRVELAFDANGQVDRITLLDLR